MCEPSSEKGTGRFLSTREGLIESFEKLFEQMSDNFTNFTLIMPMIQRNPQVAHYLQKKWQNILFQPLQTIPE